MAKISIFRVLKRQKRIRILTLFATLLLVVVMGEMIVLNGSKNTKADDLTPCYISSTDESIGDIFGTRSRKIPAACENMDVVIDGVEVYADSQPVWQPGSSNDVGTSCYSGELCDTKRRFSSLTIKNGGVLTHHGLIRNNSVNVNGSLLDSSYGPIRFKKIDIEVSGNIVLSSRGRIDANGKGYPGGKHVFRSVESETNIDPDYITSTNWITNNDGFGPGGGKGSDISGHELAGRGGGYGGAGGKNSVSSGLGGVSYNLNSNNNVDEEVEWGSGGGGAIPVSGGTNNRCVGGAGGGRIKISADSIIFQDTESKISANGDNGTTANWSNDHCAGGSGSGGSVVIKYANRLSIIPTLSDINRGILGPVDGGSLDRSAPISSDIASLATQGYAGELINNTEQLFNNQVISARGGVARYNQSPGETDVVGGGGGGGRIYIKKTGNSGISVLKTLEPLKRNGVANISFNPYALQPNDQIKVTLNIANIPSGSSVSIADDLLKTPAGSTTKKCVYDSGSNTQSSGLFDATNTSSTLTWLQVGGGTSGKATITYTCTVQ